MAQKCKIEDILKDGISNAVQGISPLFLDGKEYRVATYLGAKVVFIGGNEVIVKQGKFRLEARLLKKNEMPLLAPVEGDMSRVIHESVSCEAYYKFPLMYCLCP